MNEPRCPGCTDAATQQVHVAWLDEMSRHLKALAPRHLVALGTEGFFMEPPPLPAGRSTASPSQSYLGHPLHLYNPGAGAQCEGAQCVSSCRIAA